jgi:hypothetical protein
MTLTRHFYAIEEVLAALQYSILQYDVKKALFWCKELIDSSCAGEAISALFHIYLGHVGIQRLEWLLHAFSNLTSDEITEENILTATYQLCIADKDNSLWNISILTNALKDVPDRVVHKTPHLAGSFDDIEMYFIRSLYQHKALSACWISEYMEDVRLCQILELYNRELNRYFEKTHKCIIGLKTYDTLLGYQTKEYDKIVCYLSIMMLSLTDSQKEISFAPLKNIPQEYLEFVKELDDCYGRKCRRLYTIPKQALYGTTQRGCMSWDQTNMIHLHNIELGLIGSPYWDEVLQEYADTDSGKIIWKSEKYMEEFYDTYFPDDIPDEWSKEEKAKSHGDGVVNPSETVMMQKYSQKYYTNKSRLAWNTTKLIYTYLEGIKGVDNSFLFDHNQRVLTPDIQKRLAPVTKKKVF